MRKMRVVLGVLAAAVVTAAAVPMVVATEQPSPGTSDGVRAAAVASSAVYGIDDNNIIWEIDPLNKVFAPVNDTQLAGTSNSMAYDTGRDQFFFIHRTPDFSVDNVLRTWDRSSTGPASVPQVANRTQLGLPAQSAQPANASYFNDAYWFIPQNSTVLHRVAFTYAGETPTTPTLTTFDLSTYAAPTYPGGGFGDVAIDSDGTLYGSHTNGGRFFKIDLNLLGSTSNIVYTEIKAPVGSDPGYQLSFDANYETLFAHDFNDGAWYTIDMATGALTSLGFATVIPGSGNGFRDLGGASATNAPADCEISDPDATNNQSAPVDTEVTNPPAVLVTDINGEPVEAVDVTFAVETGGGNLDGETSAVAATGVGGVATAPAWTLGPDVGENTVTAEVGTLCSVVFTAQGTEPPAPSIALTKARDGDTLLTAPGDVVTWLMVATNTGNVPLTDVVIDDPLVAASNDCGTLLPAESCEWTVTYPLTQEDVDAGEVANFATVTGVHDGTDVTDDADAVAPVVQDPAIGISKRAEFFDPPKAGEAIQYQLVSTNTGTVTLSEVTITDGLAGLTPLVCDLPDPVTLAPGESLTCTTSYTLTQNDIDTGELPNTATTSGLSPQGQEVAAEATLVIPMTLVPGMTLTKELAGHGDVNGSGTVDTGDTLKWNVTAANTGNVTLFDMFVVDPLTGDRKECGAVAPQQTCVLATAAYTITDADSRSGRVVNDATVTARTQTGDELARNASDTVPVQTRAAVTPAASTLPVTGATMETVLWGAAALLIGGTLLVVLYRKPAGA